MRRHAKASVGSKPDTGRARLTAAAICLLALLSFLGSSAPALAAPKGITGYFGNPFSTASTASGEFDAPRGIAINNGTGDIYVADGSNNRIERFDADGNFISTWGADVISGATSGVGSWLEKTTSVTGVKAEIGRFLPGQAVSGAGIAPGTRIAAVPGVFGASYSITLSKPTIAAASNSPLTVTAGPNNVPVNERQVLTIPTTVTGGTFKLNSPNYQGYAATATATAFSKEPTPAEIQTELGLLPQIGVGNVEVTSSATGVYEILYKGARADTNMPQLTIASSTLVGGTAAIRTTVQGTAPEKCVVASECKAGVIWGTVDTEVNSGGIVASPQGIAINQGTGDLYVSQGSFRRMEQFSASGSFIRAWGTDAVFSGSEQADEQQRLTVDATGGQYKLTFGAVTTANIEWNEPASGVEAKLQPLASIAGVGGTVAVSKGPGGPGGSTPYLITFGGALADTNLAAITVSAGTSPLVGTATITTLNDGAIGFEVCQVAANCKIGVLEKPFGFNNNMGYPAVEPAGAPNAGNVLVGDTRRVNEYTPDGKFVRNWGWGTVSSGPSDTVSNEFEICRAVSLDLCTNLGSNGSGSGQFGGNPVSRLAVDPNGDVYVLDSGTEGKFRVQKFTQSGESLTPSLFNPSIGTGETLTSSSPAASTANMPTDIEIDPTNGHIWVVRAMEVGKGNPPAAAAERRVFEFDAAGNLVETHLAGFNLNSVGGFDLAPGGAEGYLSSSAPKMGVNVLGDPVPPIPALGPTTGIGSSSATLNGTVDSNGGGPLHTLYRFEYRSVGATAWTKAPAVGDADAGSEEDPVPVSQVVTGLEPNKDYEVRLIATKAGSPVTAPGNAGDFKTLATAPDVKTFVPFWDTSTGELVLRGAVDANNSAATYYFQYGTVSCSVNPCASVPVSQDASAGSGNAMVERSQSLAGLDPETTYHVRIVADNGIEVSPGVTKVFGEEMTFTTPPEIPCGNEEFRTGPSSELAECRAYEWVSNGDAWGTGVNTLPASLIADTGERAQFLAQAFGQPNSVPNANNPYIAVRGENSWSVKSVAPPPGLVFADVSLGSSRFLVSSDLGSTLWSESTRSQRLRGEVQWAQIGLDGSNRAASPLIVPLQHTGTNEDRGQSYEIRGASADLSTFTFDRQSLFPDTGYKLLADEPLLTGGRSNLYFVSDMGGSGPVFDVVNRASGKTGAVIGGVCGAGLGSSMPGTVDRGVAANAISSDGSTVYFSIRPGSPAQGACVGSSVTNPKRLFKRENGDTTVAVTASQCSPACGGPDGDDEFRGASADGSVVFFLTPRRLLNADTDSTSDLYLYDSAPPAGEPTLALASGGSGGKALDVFGRSVDGNRVYFTAEGVLTGANARGVSPFAGAHNLYVYQRDDAHPTGRTAFVATMASNDFLASPTYEALPRSGSDPGHVFVFYSSARLLNEDLDSSRDIYRYDDLSGELLCISCMGNGAFDLGIGLLRGEDRSDPSSAQRIPQASADGSAVVFVTAESLLPDADLNGAQDAYLWRGGSLSLISDPDGGVVASISKDGDSVFFYTNSALNSGDTNNAPDLYVARVGGGFPQPPPPENCSGDESCHGPAVPAPPVSSGASESFVGPGNRAAPATCTKGKVRRNGRCVRKPSRHGKKHSSKKQGKGKASKRGAGNDRGGNR